MSKFWGQGSCAIAHPFQVLLPLPEFDAEFKYHKIIKNAQIGVRNLKHFNDIINDVFTGPDIDLAFLFERKRMSHSIPSQHETAILQAYIQECTQDISSLHTTISALISNISALCNNLTEAVAQLAQRSGRRAVCEHILAPTTAKYINDDVLEKIFLECWYSRGSSKPNPFEPPLQLAAVSYRWRNMAYSIPRLWSHIRICPSSEPENIDSPLALAIKWLGRARSNPDVCMLIDIPESMSTDDPLLVQFQNALSSSSIRIKKLALDFSEDREPQDILNLVCKDRFLGLEELRAPRHRDIPIGGIKRLYLHYTPQSWLFGPPAYTNLTILRLVMEIHWDVFEWILLSCPSLEKVLASVAPTGAELSIVANEQFQMATSVKITLPHLIYMGIINGNDLEDTPDFGVPQHFLSNFILPSLQIFEYCAENRATEETVLGWLTSLTFLNQLRRLTMDLHFDIPEHTLVELFSSTTSLEELSIDAPLSDPDTLSFLTDTVPSDSSILPRLSRLHLSAGEDIGYIFKYYQELAESWFLTPSPAGSSRILGPITFHLNLNNADSEDEDTSEGDTDLMILVKERLERRMENYRELRPRRLDIAFIRHDTDNWPYNVPIMFEMLPLAFDEERVYEILDETSDTRWVRQTGAMYHVE